MSGFPWIAHEQREGGGSAEALHLRSAPGREVDRTSVVVLTEGVITRGKGGVATLPHPLAISG